MQRQLAQEVLWRVSPPHDWSPDSKCSSIPICKQTFLIHKDQNMIAVVNSFLYPMITSTQMVVGRARTSQPDRARAQYRFQPLACFRNDPPYPPDGIDVVWSRTPIRQSSDPSIRLSQ